MSLTTISVEGHGRVLSVQPADINDLTDLADDLTGVKPTVMIPRAPDPIAGAPMGELPQAAGMPASMKFGRPHNSADGGAACEKYLTDHTVTQGNPVDLHSKLPELAEQ